MSRSFAWFVSILVLTGVCNGRAEPEPGSTTTRATVILLQDAPTAIANEQGTNTQVQHDQLENYTRGLTPQFRSLLMAPESNEDPPRRQRKAAKEPQKERNLNESGELEDVYSYKDEYAGLPQSHIEQLLRYYGKIAGKLLPQGYARFRKLSPEHDKENSAKAYETEQKTATESSWTPEQPKSLQSTDQATGTAVSAAAIAANAAVLANAAALAASPASTLMLPAGTLNYLNAASYGPPAPPNAYTTALRTRLLGPPVATYGPTRSGFPVNCCSLCPCNSNVYGNGCGAAGNLNNPSLANTNGGSPMQTDGCGYGYSNNEDADNDGYGPDNYFPGGFGRSLSSQEATATLHSHLLNGYPSSPQSSSGASSLFGSAKPTSYYQVSSSGSSSPYSIDAFSPSLYGTSHVHRFGAHPTVMPYHHLLNTLAQRFNSNDNELVSGPFAPMFDNEVVSPNAQPTPVTLPTPVSSGTTKKSEMRDESVGVFRIVKPNFASLKKSSSAKKLKTTKGATKPRRSSAGFFTQKMTTPTTIDSSTPGSLQSTLSSSTTRSTTTITSPTVSALTSTSAPLNSAPANPTRISVIKSRTKRHITP